MILLLVPAARAQRELKTIPDPDPELERRSFQVADGFEVNLFAADPLLAKPIQMNFDAAGRLWVASSEMYPQILPGQKPNDRIIVLEDTKGVGRADKTTVFADGLFIPTGLEPGDGGVYVANSTELLHLSSSTGNGKADRVRVMLSGFGTEDTHHILHTFRWGPDGMLYFNQSVYIHSHIETPYGVRRLEAGGIWQFRPETMQLEVFLRGFINSWGHHFDRWGQSFVTDGAYSDGINYGLPGASYMWAKDSTRILPGLNPGSPKHCGLEILSGRHLPEAWRANAITNDFRGHRVCRFVLSEDGAGYASQEKPELIKTTHAAFRPIDVKMGPDGAIYIADWYNPIIQHGEVDFRDPRRDHTHGRIWRVTAKGRPLVPRPQLVGASIESLLEALKAPEDWTRHFAKRVLTERRAGVEPKLAAWVGGLDRADPHYERHLLEVLWLYQSLNVVEPKLLTTLLHARDHHVRAAALRVLSYWHDQIPNALELLAGGVADDLPQVRLEAVRALGKIAQPHAVEIAMHALDRPMDRFLDFGLWLTARELQAVWLPALERGHVDFGGNVRALLFALKALDSAAAVRPLVELVRAGRISGEREKEVLGILATLGGPQELGLVFERALAADARAADRRLALLAALEQAGRQRNLRPSGDLNQLRRFLPEDNRLVNPVVLRLAGLWHLEALRPAVQSAALAAGDPAVRQAGIEGLAAFGGPASRQTLEALSGSSQPAMIRQHALIALAGLDLNGAAQRTVDFLARGESPDAAELFDAFLVRKKGPEALAVALTRHKLPADVAKIGVRVVRATGRELPALVAALTQAGGLAKGPHVLEAQEFKQLVTEVLAQGDPARGEALFRRKDLACQKCHAIAGVGGQVGPDLVSIGASAPVDYLIESILLPNKAIKEGYHSLVVGTRSGRLLTGILVRETSSQLVLRDAEDREVTIPITDIEERTVGGSLMPEGLTDILTRAELVDLVRFLSELGKVGPYSVTKAQVSRRWQVLEPGPEAYRLLVGNSFLVAAGNDPVLRWSPAYARVSGDLPLAELPVFVIRKPTPGAEGERLCFVRCQVETSAPGRVLLRLNSTDGLQAWIDGTPLELQRDTIVGLLAGRHTLTLAANEGHRREDIRCTWEDVPGSATQVRVVGGK
jgi:putative heme-binding domain-containing protein